MSARKIAGALALILVTNSNVPASAAKGSGDGQSFDLVNEAAKDPSLFSFNYGPTSSPALTLLNLSPSKVSLSNGLEPFVLSIPSLFTASGGGQSAGFDVSPAWALQTEYPIHIDDYLNRTEGAGGSFWEAWYRARLEFAVTTGTASTDAKKNLPSGLALGLSTSLLSSSDPVKVSPSTGTGTFFQQCVANETNDIATANQELLLQFSAKYGDVNSLGNALNVLGGKNAQELSSEHDDPRQTLKNYLAVVPNDSTGQQVLADLTTAMASPMQSGNKVIVSIDAVHQMQAKIVATQPDFAPTALSIYDKYSIAKHAGDCVTFAAAVAASAPDLTVGVGYVENGKAGSLSNFHDGGETGWLALRVPLYSSLTSFDMGSAGFYPALEKATKDASSIVLGGSVRYSNHFLLATGDAKTPFMTANMFDAWVGLQGNLSWLQGSFEGGYTENRATDKALAAFSTSGFRWLVASKVNVYSVFWLGASYGTANGSTAKLDDKTLLVTLDIKTPSVSSIFGGASSSGQ